MKIEIEKAEKALGFRHLIRQMNLRLSSISNSVDRLADPELLDERVKNKIQKSEEDWDQYQKPGFRNDRPIKSVSMLPVNPKDETIYVVFKKSDYSIRSGRNFIHTPVIQYGNLRYASVSELKYSEKEVLDDLKRMNNGIIV